MKELITTENMKTMTSLELAKLTNKEHKNIVRDIKDEISKLGEDRGRLIFEQSEYTNSRNKKYPMYNITLDGVLQLGARYDAVIRFNLIQKVKELQTTIALSLEHKNRELESKIKQNKPKLDYLDSILESEKTLLASQIAADYDMSARALNRTLHEVGLIRKVGGQWILYKKHMEKEYTDSETIPYIDKDTGEERIKIRTRWTQKGREKIHEILTGLGISTVMDRS